MRAWRATQTLNLRAEQPRDIPTARNVNILPATLRLLHHLGNIFRHDALITPATLRIDSKRRKRLQEKRMAMGHKRDDHEEEQLHHVNNYTMR